MCNLMEIADRAELIINGYAFTKVNDNVKVLNLNNPSKATLLHKKGEVLETSMDDIELDIVIDYYNRNRKYMEE